MKKKLLFLTLVLLIIPILTTLPVLAKPKVNYTEVSSLTKVSTGKAWTSEDLVRHWRGDHWLGVITCTLGTGTIETWNNINLYLVTGEGTGTTKWKITIDGSTLEGTHTLKFTGWTTFPFASFTGEAVGTHGTDDFEGVKLKSSLTGIVAGGNWDFDATGTVMGWPTP